jgi:hypothetical protein
MSKKQTGVNPVVYTIEEMFEVYPETKKLETAKSTEDWNKFRKELKDQVPLHVISFIDMCGLVKQIGL